VNVVCTLLADDFFGKSHSGYIMGQGRKVQRLSKVQQVISLLTFLSILLTRINRVAFEQ